MVAYKKSPAIQEKQEEEKQEEESQQQQQSRESRNEEWLMSGYGHDQLYINAALLERYRNSQEGEGGKIDWKKISKTQAKRLKQEGASDRSIQFVQHVFDLAHANPHSNPIDFML